MGRYDLRLSEEDFWPLTLGLFSQLAERWTIEQARLDRRAGEVVAMLYNINRDTKKDPKGRGWDDFFPQQAKPEPEPQTEEQMLMAMKMWAAMINKRTAKA